MFSYIHIMLHSLALIFWMVDLPAERRKLNMKKILAPAVGFDQEKNANSVAI
jgi:hypothetical protein